MKKILVTRQDGSVAIVSPGDAATEATMLRDALRVEGYVSHREIEDSEIPQDRTFRNAWKDAGSGIEEDLAKAKEIHKNKLRELRAPKLAALDVEYIKADETKDSAKKLAISKKKQELRDVTSSLPDTIEELKSHMPDILK